MVYPAQWFRRHVFPGIAKRDLPIMVIVGNPPYSGHSENNGTWISELINDYKFVDGQPLGERNSKWLQDDYVKFIRFAQWRLDQSGSGVLAFISNNGYLDNPTFRGMRHSLLQSFHDIYILNLHGSTKKKETTPEGGKDENVFDIQQGVCIGIFVKLPNTRRKCQVHYADLWGKREEKYEYLDSLDLSKTKWTILKTQSPDYLMIDQNQDLKEEYNKGFSLTDLFGTKSIGIVTARDDLTIHFTREEAIETAAVFKGMDTEKAREHFRLGKDVRDWKVDLAKADLQNLTSIQSHGATILYRPFDLRETVYTGKVKGFHCMPRPEVMSNLLEPGNVALITTRTTNDKWDAYITKTISGHKTCSAYDANYILPLYLVKASAELDFGEAERTANLTPEILEKLSASLRLRFEDGGPGDLEKTFGPEDVFHYVYAVLHCPGYRARYADFLKMDFPRIPLPTGREPFAALARLGRELCELHLLESPLLGQNAVSYPVAGDNRVGKSFPKHEKDRVYINATQYFSPVSEQIWTFSVGGYQPAEKWLKDRRGRVLTHADLQHYKRLLAAQNESLRVMREIDTRLPDWPFM